MIAALNKYFDNIPYNMIHSETNLVKGSDMVQTGNIVGLPRFLSGRDSEQYESILNTVFASSCHEDSDRIDFESDAWDFNPLVKDGVKNLLKILFTTVNNQKLKMYLKYFVLYMLCMRTKPSTACKHVNNLKNLFSGFLFIETIDMHEIVRCIEKSSFSGGYKASLIQGVILFMEFLKDNYNLSFNLTANDLREKMKSIAVDPNKYPLIPWELYNKMMETAIQVQNDASRKTDERLLACALVIQMQSGLRTSDLVALKTDDLIINEEDGEKVYSLNYYENKSSKLDSGVYILIDVSKPCGEAFELAKTLRYDSDSTYLLVDKSGTPWESPKYYRWYHSFMVKNMYDEIIRPWDNIEKRKLRVTSKGIFAYYSEDQLEAYVPYPHSFRVNVCTMLVESKMYSRQYCRKHLGHLSSNLDNYYCRPANRTPEINKRVSEIITDMLRNISPLGGRNDGDKIAENIRRFMETEGQAGINKKILPLTDEQLIEKMNGRLTFNPVNGGCCIKVGTDSMCNLYGKDNSINCAYGQCENIYHFYYNLPETLAQFRMVVVNYRLALKQKHVKQAEKYNRMARKYAKTVSLEMDQLENVIQGTNDVRIKHPELIPIIDELDQIQKEVESWL